MDKKKPELTGDALEADMEREVDAKIKDKPNERAKALKTHEEEEAKKDKVKAAKLKEQKDAVEAL